MITLKEAKNYLRVDYDEDDKLIQNLLSTSKQLVMDVGRMSQEDFSVNEDTVRTAVLFALGYLYENRSNPDYKKLTLNLRSILFVQKTCSKTLICRVLKIINCTYKRSTQSKSAAFISVTGRKNTETFYITVNVFNKNSSS